MPSAEKSLSYTDISKETFTETLSQYPSAVPDHLRELDAFRYDEIPATLAQRAETGEAYLKKEEVTKLVEWKLKHGTFRPTLLALVTSNPAPTIESITRTAFSTSPTESALKHLTTLKGIGPATASLLLSTSSPSTTPFFSDELFRWVTWEDPLPAKGAPARWKRGIKYSAKEYEVVLRRVGEVVGRLGVRADEVERVAWVLGRRGVDVGGGEEEDRGGMGKGEKGDGARREGVKKGVEVEVENAVQGKSKPTPAKKVKGGAKRKAEEVDAPADGVRRSTRRKPA